MPPAELEGWLATDESKNVGGSNSGESTGHVTLYDAVDDRIAVLDALKVDRASLAGQDAQGVILGSAQIGLLIQGAS